MKNKVKNKIMQSWLIFGLIVVNIIFLIFLANFFYLRFDLTEGQKYSISKPTKNLVRSLTSNMTIEYYYNDKAKEVRNMALVVQYAEDILKEIQSYSRGNVNVIIRELSYEKNMEEIADLEEEGIMQFPLVQSDTSEVRQVLGFSGIILKYKGQKEVITAVQGSEGLEFDLAVAIKKLSAADSEEQTNTAVGILVGAPGKSIERDYRHIRYYIKEQFGNEVDISSGQSIPEEVTTLLVIGADMLTGTDLFNIDQFMMKGGNVMFAVSGIIIDYNNQNPATGGPMVFPSQSGLFDMLTHYGVTINKDLVGDNESHNEVMTRTRGYPELSRYPVWVNVKSVNFNPTSSVVANLPELKLLWTSSVKAREGLTGNLQTLFTTTAQAWADTSNFKIQPDEYLYHRLDANEKFDLAIQYDGEFTSFFAGKDIPVDQEGAPVSDSIVETGTSSIIVIGNDRFIDSNELERGGAGELELIFALNAVESLHTDSALIKLRSKGMFERRLDRVARPVLEKVKTFVIVFSTYIMPILFIIGGVAFYFIRKKRLEKLKQSFEQ